MTGDPGAKGAPRPLADEGAQGQDVLGLRDWERDAMLAWVGENLTLVRRSASGQRILYWSLGIGFVLGLAAHVGGFLLKASATTEPLMLAADLLYALGWALWTGAVVVVFVQVYPETKKRQYKQALDAYEAAVGRQSRGGSGQAPAPGQDWQAEIAEIAAVICDLDPLADDHDDKFAALRAKLRDYQGRPVTQARTEAMDTDASEALSLRGTNAASP
jgi:hypothetical protein